VSPPFSSAAVGGRRKISSLSKLDRYGLKLYTKMTVKTYKQPIIYRTNSRRNVSIWKIPRRCRKGKW
jgi:hypothetical protein